MSCREISETIKKVYNAGVSATLISKITSQIINEIIRWQNHPSDAIYPVIFTDNIVVKIRNNQHVSTTLYLVQRELICPIPKNNLAYSLRETKEKHFGYRFNWAYEPKR